MDYELSDQFFYQSSLFLSEKFVFKKLDFFVNVPMNDFSFTHLIRKVFSFIIRRSFFFPFLCFFPDSLFSSCTQSSQEFWPLMYTDSFDCSENYD